ncbi:hypothetical protein P700755_000186 [Psychroflexus torquis ATCC 700755]|uniref:Uncharacterized protein n=1 Tax=Psychroflexus torquis (strain ATCC 700755 / CIP 106069 / ACAM 623) TaxID=313595 RepID=K4I9C8_PSYTT|nr:hypothetical protein [Psychroflexus torquis]AFU67242.1 hypothetical protein P700755_000186 [Psychroflexus torquis ATCC 700755]
MDFSKAYITKLLDLYDDGETTLEQERDLKSYFASEFYDKDFEPYALLFSYFETESKTTSKVKLDVESPKPNKFLWLNIAASIVVVIGAVWFFTYYEKQQDMQEARIAFEKTQNALNFLSFNMNEGLEKLEYIEVFNTQKNKIIK